MLEVEDPSQVAVSMYSRKQSSLEDHNHHTVLPRSLIPQTALPQKTQIFVIVPACNATFCAFPRCRRRPRKPWKTEMRKPSL